MRNLGRLAGLVLLCASVTACGASVKPDAQYKTLEDLRDAVVASGYECPTWTVTDGRGSCLGQRDQLRIYDNAEARDKDQEGAILGTQLIMVTSREDQAMLIGPNWILRGPADKIPALKTKMGGYIPDISDVRVPGLTG